MIKMVVNIEKVLHFQNQIVYKATDESGSVVRLIESRNGITLLAGMKYEVSCEVRGGYNYVVGGVVQVVWNVTTLDSFVNFSFDSEIAEKLMDKVGRTHIERAMTSIQKVCEEITHYQNSKESISDYTFTDDEEDDSNEVKEDERFKLISRFEEEFKNKAIRGMAQVFYLLVSTKRKDGQFLTFSEIYSLIVSKFPKRYLTKCFDEKYSYNEIVNGLFDLKALNEWSIPFSSMDKAFKNIGGDLRSEKRVKGAVYTSFIETIQEGHIYATKKELIRNFAKIYSEQRTAQQLQDFLRNENKAYSFYEFGNSILTVNYQAIASNTYFFKSMLELPLPLFERFLNELIVEGLVIKKNEGSDFYYPEFAQFDYKMHSGENEVAISLLRRHSKMKEHDEITKKDVEDYLNGESFPYQLEEKQAEFILNTATTKGGISVLNGGAGRGKTFTLNVFIEVVEDLSSNARFTLLAPTGRASKRMNELGDGTNQARTIHSLVYSEEEVTGGYENYIIIDESSMIDMKLFQSLLKLIPEEAKIILVGHDRQLESVGAGRVFTDIIESDIFSVTNLEVAKRFSSDSKIFDNAENILAYRSLIDYGENNEQEVFYENTAKDITMRTINQIEKLIVDDVNLDETQVLIPTYKGLVGVNYMNYLIKSTFFSMYEENSVPIFNKNFYVTVDGKSSRFTLNFNEGDKVICTSNMSLTEFDKRGKVFTSSEEEKVVYNGELGRIIKIGNYQVPNPQSQDKTDKITMFGAIVKMDDVYYFVSEKTLKKSFDLAYAMSVHKAQGSEWKNTFLLLHEVQGRFLLKNNITYTGFTRASEYQCTIGTRKAIDSAIRNETRDVRNTHLIKKCQINKEVVEQKIQEELKEDEKRFSLFEKEDTEKSSEEERLEGTKESEETNLNVLEVILSKEIVDSAFTEKEKSELLNVSPSTLMKLVELSASKEKDEISVESNVSVAENDTEDKADELFVFTQ